MQALLDWVSHNSDYAIFAVFFVSTLESLALVGIMVPGMLFMLGVGTLIGIGTLSFWPMYIAATLGAIAGDGLSFWLGRHFNQNLRHLWPLPKFPGLLQKGEAFFHRHGAMSVLFGRFVGPLRAIIPAVAGMLRMEPGRFLVFNVISALAWAPVVLLPGAILGASLAQVSAVAMRFGLLLFIIGLAFWCIGWLINHGMRRLVIVRFPNLPYAQAWRYSMHALVYSIIIVTALFYRLQLPSFPDQTQLQLVLRQPPAHTEPLSDNLKSIINNGFSVLWIGDASELAKALEQQGWQKAERWNLTTALAWLADNTDPMQLAFSDPRLKMYKFPLKNQTWIKSVDSKKVWLFQSWLLPNNRPELQGTLTLGAVKRVTMRQGVMGYCYFSEDPLSTAQQQAFYSDPSLFPAALQQSFHRLTSDGDSNENILLYRLNQESAP